MFMTFLLLLARNHGADGSYDALTAGITFSNSRRRKRTEVTLFISKCCLLETVRPDAIQDGDMRPGTPVGYQICDILM